MDSESETEFEDESESEPQIMSESDTESLELNVSTTRKASNVSLSDPPLAKKCKLNDSSDDPEIDEDMSMVDMENNAFREVTLYTDKYEGDYSFTVLAPKDLMSNMFDSINETKNILQLPVKTTRLLLNHFRWDKDKLFERYYDIDNSQLLKEVGITGPVEELAETTASGIVSVSATEECTICFTEMSTTDSMYYLQCGHRFCINCWCGYLMAMITGEGRSETIKCPAYNCCVLIDDSTVMKLVKDDKVIEKYHQLLTKCFVECHRLLRWCPSPECFNAIHVENVECKPVKCSCRCSFCFNCGVIWHGPLNCSLLKTWKKKCDDDSETSNWLASHTKDCPKCHSPIEKNGGCNHMSCKKCHFQFCWICMGDWKAHKDSYNCNSYNAQASKEKESTRKALERYLFYCNRYMNHMNSLKFENKLYRNVELKMEELQKSTSMTYYDALFLTQAVDILCRCRNTLMCTYAFAFYLEKTTQAVIFEGNQSDLEVATESMSEYLERDLNTADAADIKPKLLNLSIYCDRRRQVLLEHVYEGYEKDLWTYNENFPQ